MSTADNVDNASKSDAAGMDAEQVAAAVENLIADIVGAEPDEYDPATETLGDIGADSLAMVELAEAVEDLAGVDVDESTLTALGTPAAIVTFVLDGGHFDPVLDSTDSPGGQARSVNRCADGLRAANRFRQRIVEQSDRQGVRFLATGERVGWGTLHNDADRYRAALDDLSPHGFGAGTKVAIIGGSGREVVTAIEAIWLTGAAVAVMPIPFRFDSVEAFTATVAERVRLADIEMVLTDELADVLLADADLGVPVVSLSAVAASAEGREPMSTRPELVADDDTAILQFTSGSTSAPRAVDVTYGVLETNLAAVADHVNLGPDDTVLSWLPLYHDMGLVGVLASAMTRGCDLVLASPQDYIADPSQWMRWASQYRANYLVGPNSAYARAAHSLATSEETLDLSSVRVALNGAEPIAAQVVRDWVAAGERHGLDPACVFPVFGMAEVGIAVSFGPKGAGLRTDVVDTNLLAVEGCAVPTGIGSGDQTSDQPSDVATSEFVLLGRPLPCLTVEIRDVATGGTLGPRLVGELCLSGPSVARGYYKMPEANAAAYRDGWFHTGDLAYLTEEGELVCCGRIKDTIIVAGRNIYPQDLELAAESVPGIRQGNTVAFGVPDARHGERVVIVAESRVPDSGDLRRNVRTAVVAETDVAPRKIVIVPPGTLPKTSSGKLQRSAARSAYLAGVYRPADHRQASPA